MSMPWGVIQRRSDFWPTLAASIEYCEGPQFPVPYFAQSCSRSLRAILAWCANGREPRYPERGTIRMGWVIGREMDDAGLPRAGEWADMADRLIGLTNYFEWWPTDEQIARRARFHTMSAMAQPRTPSADEIRATLWSLETALRTAGHWSNDCPEPARLAGSELTPVEMMQFGVMPELHRILSGAEPPPRVVGSPSHAVYLANRMAAQPELWPVMYALSDRDHLFFTPAWPELELEDLPAAT
jgi:uncharacterized protein YqcC (DUF446 family)